MVFEEANLGKILVVEPWKSSVGGAEDYGTAAVAVASDGDEPSSEEGGRRLVDVPDEEVRSKPAAVVGIFAAVSSDRCCS